jgi:hypothetical protein
MFGNVDGGFNGSGLLMFWRVALRLGYLSRLYDTVLSLSIPFL